MHQGVLVPADGYYGAWMTEVIRRLRGHHEPQEELLFDCLLRHCRPGTHMLEIGAFWAYYTAWFLTSVPGSTATCVEPDPDNLACGKRTLQLNALDARWIEAAAGRHFVADAPFRRDGTGELLRRPVHCLGSILDACGHGAIEVLHVDAQGAELPFLESIADAGAPGQVRFVVVSTHDASISGSRTTHEDCLRAVERLGGVVLAEHSVEESFSGDGLVVASLDRADAGLAMPAMSRNQPRSSLFGLPPAAGGEVVLARTNHGPMLVRDSDTIIGRGLRECAAWEEGEVVEVVRYLRRAHRFHAGTFVDVGANIGTHLLQALRGGMFRHGAAMEMDPRNFALLQANVALALEAPWPLLLNLAVGERVGDAVMARASGNLGDHRVRAGAAADGAVPDRDGREEVAVPMSTLDRIAADHRLTLDGSTLVWIDTQGHEGHVLAGAREILARPAPSRPAVVCEFWPIGLERSGRLDALMAFLDRCSAVHDIRRPGWQSAPPMSIADIEGLYRTLLASTTPTSPKHTDLLCIP